MRVSDLRDWALSISLLPPKGCLKNADLEPAIQKFCYKQDANGKLTNDIMVPSEYGDKGVRVGNTVVAIRGICSPAQWVPQDICIKQFHEMCADGDDELQAPYGWKQDGVHRCQTFYYHDTTKKSIYVTN